VKAHVRLPFPQLKSTVITSTSVLDSSRSYDFANPNHRQMAQKEIKMQKRSSIAIPHPVKTKMSRARRKHVLLLGSTPSVRYVALLVNATNINIMYHPATSLFALGRIRRAWCRVRRGHLTPPGNGRGPHSVVGIPPHLMYYLICLSREFTNLKHIFKRFYMELQIDCQTTFCAHHRSRDWGSHAGRHHIAR